MRQGREFPQKNENSDKIFPIKEGLLWGNEEKS